MVGGIWPCRAEQGDDELECTGATEEVTGHRLGRAEDQLVGVVTEHGLDGLRLGDVAQGRRGAVRIDVPDAGTVDSAVGEAHPHRARLPALRGPERSCGTRRAEAVPEDLAEDRRPPRSACSRDSRTTAAPPSPSTKPSRSLSNGRLAPAGSSLRVDIAFMLAKAATVRPVIAASEPPEIIASATPSRIDLNDLADRVGRRRTGRDGGEVRPLEPVAHRDESRAMLGMNIGTKKGETRSGPCWR